MKRAAGDERVDLVKNMQANVDKRGMAKILVQGGGAQWSNYHTISLIVHVSKMLMKIIKDRIKLHYDREMADEQDFLWKELENK